MSGFFIKIYKKLIQKPFIFYLIPGFLIAIVVCFSSCTRLPEYFTQISPDSILSFMHHTLNDDFKIFVTLSVSLVFLILLIVFGRFEMAVITMLPMAIWWGLIFGFMKLINLGFNTFNIIILSIIFLFGIVYSIFIVQGSMIKYKYGMRDLSTHRISILITTATIFIGLAVLLIVKYPALHTIATISVFGISSAVIISFLLAPALFSAIVYSKGKKRIEPVTLTTFLVSIIAFMMFLGGSALMTSFIPILFILPIGHKRSKYFFHVLVSFTMRIIVYSIFPIQKVIETGKTLNFKQPSVIVCNHQSHLDLSIILMLHPKIIVLTNRWVWNNPFYGFVVRFADYLPIYKGIDQKLLVRLQKKIAQGYSILVFPEGTRTRDGQINRFHQGAFWLADNLNIEIQPLLLHGANHCMIKGEFFLRTGSITLRSMDKIRVRKIKDGESYQSQARELRKIYRSEFEKISRELETPGYFRKKLINQFLYKGPVLEWYAKIKISLEKNYAWFNNIIPRDASIVDIGCGYGFLSHILCMVSDQRRIIGIDYDGNKIAVARQIATSMQNAKFEEADILHFELPYADVFLLLDVLHYLPAASHEVLIEKCMSKLNANGIIILRDADADLTNKIWRTKFNEFNSTQFFRFNRTNIDSLKYTSGTIIGDIAHRNGFTVERKENVSETSDITFILKPVRK